MNPLGSKDLWPEKKKEDDVSEGKGKKSGKKPTSKPTTKHERLQAEHRDSEQVREDEREDQPEVVPPAHQPREGDVAQGKADVVGDPDYSFED